MVQYFMKTQRIEISYKTILFIAGFAAVLALLWQIKSILILFFVCFIFMEAINPTIIKMERFKIPRIIAILIIYTLIISIISFAIAGIIPVFVEQTGGLVDSLPRVFNNIELFGIKAQTIDWSSQIQVLENLPAEIAKAVLSLFSNVLSGFVILVVTLYMLLERKNIQKYSFHFFGKDGRELTVKIFESLENRLGHWVNAEILLMTTIGVISYIGYSLIGLTYTVPLAIIAGLLEAVPNIGPTVATLLAAIVGLTISPLHGLLAVILGILIQQIENNFIVPKVMKETVGLNPLITILLIAVGAKLGGVVGAILAIPVYLTLEVIFRVISERKK